MKITSWLNTLQGSNGRRRTSTRREARRRETGTGSNRTPESLEVRIVPATSITILDSGVGDLDGFLSATDGTITEADVTAAANGTLSRAALQGVGPDVAININSPGDITFSDLTSPLVLQTSSPHLAFFSAAGNIGFADTTDTLSTSGGGLGLDAGGSAALANLSTVSGSNGGNVQIFADALDIVGSINAGNGATGGRVTVFPSTASTVGINLGTEIAGQLSLTNIELNRITARVLQVGSVFGRDIAISSAIVLGPNVPTLNLSADGGVLDGTGTEQPDISVASLALTVGGGLGAADDLDLQVTNLVFTNLVGAVNLVNSGALTLTTVDGFTSSFNNGSTTTVVATSPITFAVDTTTAGNTTYTAGETLDNPIGADDIIVNAGVTITVTGGNLLLRAGDDVILGAGSAVSAASGSLSLVAGFSDFDGLGQFVDLGTTLTSGAGLGISAAEDLIVNSLTAAGQTVTLRSPNGSVLDGNGAAVNVTAAALAVLAGTGIGIGAEGALETAVGALEAQTGTGGLFLSNTGDLSIGSVNADPNLLPVPLEGVKAITSGDIQLINAGSIILAGTNVEDIRSGNGNVEVQAVGATADVDVRNNSGDSIDSNLGNVTVSAGRDILIGDPITDAFGSVEADGNIQLTAGQNIILDENGRVRVTGTGTVTADAGSNVSVLAVDGTTGARITTEGGTLSITTGAGGRLTIASGATFALDTTQTAAADGDIILNVDDLLLFDPITAGTGIVTLQQATATRQIDLGSNTGGTLALEDAELDRITATLLRIGRTDSTDTGFIEITAQITGSASYGNTLSLRSGTFIVNASAGDLDVTNVALQSGFGTNLSNGLHGIRSPPSRWMGLGSTSFSTMPST